MGKFEILGKRIKELRSKLNMTQKEFAKLVGCTSATLSAYENGSKSPSLEIVRGIALNCNVTIDWLCGLSEKENISDTCSTYSDVLSILLEIDKILPFIVINSDDVGKVIYGASKSIAFKSTQMNKFLIELEKYKRLLSEESIDQDIYQACIEKLLRDSDGFINDANGELPFD